MATVLNRQLSVEEQVWIIQICCDGGGTTLFLDRKELKRYNADPDGFAAKHFGFETLEDYYRWCGPNAFETTEEYRQACGRRRRR